MKLIKHAQLNYILNHGDKKLLGIDRINPKTSQLEGGGICRDRDGHTEPRQPTCSLNHTTLNIPTQTHPEQTQGEFQAEMPGQPTAFISLCPESVHHHHLAIFSV